MKARVLIVDDSALSRRTLRQILEPAGYEVPKPRTGSSRSSAISRQAGHRAARPRDEGHVRPRRARQAPRARRGAKVVVVSADIQTSSRQLVEEAGAKAFVNKPFDRAEILEHARPLSWREPVMEPHRASSRTRSPRSSTSASVAPRRRSRS